MNKKIYLYLYLMKIKYILLNIFFIGLFVLLINLLEISRMIEEENSGIFSILYLSILKIPTIIIDITPFVIVISTAFIYRYLINNNEIISLRNIGFSLLDIYKPISIAIFFTGLLVLIIFNPLSTILEKKFDKITTKDFSDQYSINIKNNELWIKNIKNLDEKYFINISNIDLENMNANNIKIISITKDDNYFFLSKKGSIIDKQFNLNDVIILNIDNDEYEKRKNLKLDLNFDNKNLIDSISNYKHIPFYKYKEHLKFLSEFAKNKRIQEIYDHATLYVMEKFSEKTLSKILLVKNHKEQFYRDLQDLLRSMAKEIMYKYSVKRKINFSYKKTSSWWLLLSQNES